MAVDNKKEQERDELAFIVAHQRDGVGEPVNRLDVPTDNALHLIQGVRNVRPPRPLPRLHNQYLHGVSSFWSGTMR